MQPLPVDIIANVQSLEADITGQVQESKEMHETLLRFAEKKTATGRRSKLMSSTVDIFDENSTRSQASLLI